MVSPIPGDLLIRELPGATLNVAKISHEKNTCAGEFFHNYDIC